MPSSSKLPMLVVLLSQGLQWYTAGLHVDEDGDAAHEFIAADQQQEATHENQQKQAQKQQQQQVRPEQPTGTA